jgi:predicted nucleic acid-binding protein
VILLDTNVVSELTRSTPDQRVVGWLNRRFSECAVSSVTVLELMSGFVMLAPGRRRDVLEMAVQRLVRRFGSRVYAFDLAAAEASARLLAKARESGLGLHQLPGKLADLQIAGIADAYGLDLATRDIGDFAGLGLALINPWDSPP